MSAQTWSLRFRATCGLTRRIAEGDFREMQERAKRYLARHRQRDGDFEAPVTVLAPGRHWEVEEPEDCMLIPDWCGELRIVPADDPTWDGE